MGGSSSKKVACAPAEEGADAGDGADVGDAGDASAPAAGDEAGEEDDDDWEYDEGGGDETDAERSRRRYANAKASTKNVKEFCEKLGIRTTERSKLRALFDAHDKMHADGLVDIAEFCRGSEMDSLPFMHRVFDAMDTDEHLTAELAEGKLDYHEFLIGVYNFCALPGGDYLAKVCRDEWHTMTRAVSKEVLAEPLSGTVEFGRRLLRQAGCPRFTPQRDRLPNRRCSSLPRADTSQLLFDMYDSDISGWLSAAQYRAMGEDLMPDRAQDALLARTDLDANGRVTFKEFRNGCRKCREEGVESPYDRALRYQAALRARATEVAPGWWDEQVDTPPRTRARAPHPRNQRPGLRDGSWMAQCRTQTTLRTPRANASTWNCETAPATTKRTRRRGSSEGFPTPGSGRRASTTTRRSAAGRRRAPTARWRATRSSTCPARSGARTTPTRRSEPRRGARRRRAARRRANAPPQKTTTTPPGRLRPRSRRRSAESKRERRAQNRRTRKRRTSRKRRSAKSARHRKSKPSRWINTNAKKEELRLSDWW